MFYWHYIKPKNYVWFLINLTLFISVMGTIIVIVIFSRPASKLTRHLYIIDQGAFTFTNGTQAARDPLCPLNCPMLLEKSITQVDENTFIVKFKGRNQTELVCIANYPVYWEFDMNFDTRFENPILISNNSTFRDISVHQYTELNISQDPDLHVAKYIAKIITPFEGNYSCLSVHNSSEPEAMVILKRTSEPGTLIYSDLSSIITIRRKYLSEEIFIPCSTSKFSGSVNITLEQIITTTTNSFMTMRLLSNSSTSGFGIDYNPNKGFTIKLSVFGDTQEQLDFRCVSKNSDGKESILFVRNKQIYQPYFVEGINTMTFRSATYSRSKQNKIKVCTGSNVPAEYVMAICTNLAHCDTIRKLMAYVVPNLPEGIASSPYKHGWIRERTSANNVCKDISPQSYYSEYTEVLKVFGETLQVLDEIPGHYTPIDWKCRYLSRHKKSLDCLTVTNHMRMWVTVRKVNETLTGVRYEFECACTGYSYKIAPNIFWKIGYSNSSGLRPRFIIKDRPSYYLPGNEYPMSTFQYKFSLEEIKNVTEISCYGAFWEEVDSWSVVNFDLSRLNKM